MTDDFQFGVKVRVFNYNLDKAIVDRAKRDRITKGAVATILGIGIPQMYAYLRFAREPSEERKLKIAIALGVPVEHIFPEAIDGFQLEKPGVKTMTVGEAEVAGLMAPAMPELEDITQRVALTDAVPKLLRTLTNREALVIRKRFGLVGERGQTFDEVASDMGITRERIRQIETRALRKLRHPSRRKMLNGIDGVRDVVEDVGMEDDTVIRDLARGWD